MIFLALAFIGAFIGCVCYLFGIYTERQAWNSLIEDGLIPKPNKKS